MPKSHAYLQTMTERPAKFQIDQYKTVWGVARTRYSPSVDKYLSRKQGITPQGEPRWEKGEPRWKKKNKKKQKNKTKKNQKKKKPKKQTNRVRVFFHDGDIYVKFQDPSSDHFWPYTSVADRQTDGVMDGWTGQNQYSPKISLKLGAESCHLNTDPKNGKISGSYFKRFSRYRFDKAFQLL